MPSKKDVDPNTIPARTDMDATTVRVAPASVQISQYVVHIYAAIKTATNAQRNARLVRARNAVKQMQKPTHIAIVLLGETGTGKSSTANALLGEPKKFAVSSKETGTTQTTSGQRCTIGETEVTVIDTPGLFDVPQPTKEIIKLKKEIRTLEDRDKSEQDYLDLKERRTKLMDLKESVRQQRSKNIKDEIAKCINITRSTHTHAFFLVNRVSTKFTTATQDTLDQIIDAFGAQHLKNYLFLVFTHADQFDEGVTPKMYLESDLHPIRQELLAECGHRAIFVNNKAPESGWRERVIRDVYANLERLDYKPFSSKHYEMPRVRKAEEQVFVELKAFEDCYTNVATELNTLASGLISNRKASNIGQAIAAGGSLSVGSALVVLGLVLALPTAGASIALSATGAAISGLGVIGTATAKGVDYARNLKGNTTYQAKAEELQPAAQKLWAAYEKYNDVFGQAVRLIPCQAGECGVEAVRANPASAVEISLKATKVGADIAGVVADSLKFTGVATGTIAATVTPVGLIFGGIIDIVTLVLVARNMKQGNITKVACAIEKYISRWNRKLKLLKADINLRKQFCHHFFDNPETFISEWCICSVCEKQLRDPKGCLADLEKPHFSGCTECVDDYIASNKSCPVCKKEWPQEPIIPDTCVICIGDMNDPVSCLANTTNQHMSGCNKCIKSWHTTCIKEGRQATCPVCQMEWPSDSIMTESWLDKIKGVFVK